MTMLDLIKALPSKGNSPGKKENVSSRKGKVQKILTKASASKETARSLPKKTELPENSIVPVSMASDPSNTSSDPVWKLPDFSISFNCQKSLEALGQTSFKLPETASTEAILAGLRQKGAEAESLRQKIADQEIAAKDKKRKNTSPSSLTYKRSRKNEEGGDVTAVESTKLSEPIDLEDSAEFQKVNAKGDLPFLPAVSTLPREDDSGLIAYLDEVSSNNSSFSSLQVLDPLEASALRNAAVDEEIAVREKEIADAAIKAQEEERKRIEIEEMEKRRKEKEVEEQRKREEKVKEKEEREKEKKEKKEKKKREDEERKKNKEKKDKREKEEEEKRREASKAIEEERKEAVRVAEERAALIAAEKEKESARVAEEKAALIAEERKKSEALQALDKSGEETAERAQIAKEKTVLSSGLPDDSLLGDLSNKAAADHEVAVSVSRAGKNKMIPRSAEFPSLPIVRFASPERKHGIVFIETDNVLLSNEELKRRRKEGEKTQKRDLERMDLERLRGSDRLSLTADPAVTKDTRRALRDCDLNFFPNNENVEIEEGELPQHVEISPQLTSILNPMFKDVRSMLMRERTQNDQIRNLEEKLRSMQMKERTQNDQIRAECDLRVAEIARALKKAEKEAEYYKGKAAALSAENERLRSGHGKIMMRPGTSSDHPAERSQPEIVLIPMEQVDKEMSKIHRSAMLANHSLVSVMAAVNDMQDVAAHVGRNRPPRR